MQCVFIKVNFTYQGLL